jgi:hypothetical protein
MKYPRKYFEPFVTLAISLAIALAFIALYTAVNSTNRLVKGQNAITKRLEKGAKARDQNVQNLIADNAQQTLILCKLILGDSTTLNQTDVAQVEAICKEKIKQATQADSKAIQVPQTISTPSTPVQPQNQPSTPQNKPQDNPKPTPPDNDGVIIDLPLLPKVHIPSPL